MANETHATHELKTWPEPFAAVVAGTKTYEIRKADRPFAVGDVLRLREWSPTSQHYSGAEAWVRVTYMTTGGAWGLPADVCVMGIAVGVVLDGERAYRGVGDDGIPIRGTCPEGRCDCAPGADCLASCPHVPGTVCVCLCHDGERAGRAA